MGSKAIYMKDLNGHFWISKWSPEQKLQRLILDGNLMKAKQFADHYGLEGETIKQKELEYLVRQDQKHSRIKELLNEIQGKTSKISNIFQRQEIDCFLKSIGGPTLDCIILILVDTH